MTRKARMLIVVPPFAGIDRPSLGAHVLQAVARRDGKRIDVLYANLILAGYLGEVLYETIAFMPTLDLYGERIMGAIASPDIHEPNLDAIQTRIDELCAKAVTPAIDVSFSTIRQAVEKTVVDVVACISTEDYAIIGFSTTFEQTNATALMARAVRAALPQTTIVIGGANCEGAMAQGIHSLVPEADYVFSGEGETQLCRLLDGDPAVSTQPIISCEPNLCVADLPENNYSEYFEQLNRYLPDSVLSRSGQIQVPYESSRGCWWGQKHHCTFCGLNGDGMTYRQKTARKVAQELKSIARSTGVNRICMSDNIMPHGYFNELLPLLAADTERFEVFYEQKANMNLRQVSLLKDAGVTRIQPGIEALNTSILKLIKKGTTAKQNIRLLRYCRSVGVEVAWNLIHRFPGEQADWYDDLPRLISRISHLQPPSGLCKLSIDRFSPYYCDPSHHGLRNLRPVEAYFEAFPPSVAIPALAYHFCADYDPASDGRVDWREIREAIEKWKSRWFASQARPVLYITPDTSGGYLLLDTRTDDLRLVLISADQAQAALSENSSLTPEVAWAQEFGLVEWIDDTYVPLACASPQLIEKFEADARQSIDSGRADVRSLAQGSVL